MSTEQKLSSDLVGQRQHRIEKVRTLLSLGLNPYPAKGLRTVSNNEIVTNFADHEDKTVTVVGRLMTWRSHGELVFADLQDDTGRIQLYIKVADLADTNIEAQSIGPDHFDLLDIGDHVEAIGTVTKTKTGQESVLVQFIRLLSKSLRPLPNKWTGIVDKESRFRRRYLDMTMNPEVRERFKRRAKFWAAVREILDEEGFHEINTPVLEHTTGGADARPFVTHYDALGEDFYLRISHELPLKRLLGAGFEKVYDLGPRFRNEGFSDEHLPEHIAMEWYWAYSDYRDGMKLTERLFKHALKSVYGTLQFNVRGFEIDLDKEWEEIDYATIIKEKFDVDIFDDSLDNLSAALVANSDSRSEDLIMNRSRLSDGLWKLIRPTLGGPFFLTGVPKFLSPLSKTNQEDPRKSDRFHPIIAGSELANAFSELNDPQDQLERFLDQQKMRDSGDDEAHMLDIDFVEMLEYGMPPAVGFGMSERVFWIFEDVSAREGVPFPPMRSGYDNSTLKVYDGVVNIEVKKRLKETVSTTKLPESTKIALLLNKELEGWKLTNTVGHLSASLAGRTGNSIFGRESFKTVDSEIPSNPAYPIVAMSATNQQLQNLLEKIKDNGLEHMIFIKDMVDCLTDDEVQLSLNDKKLAELEIYGIGLIGPDVQIKAITKKFSLWK